MSIRIKQTEGDEGPVRDRGTGVDSVRTSRRGPNSFVAELEQLRSRARSLVATKPYARRGLNQLVAHLVGSGIMGKVTPGEQPVVDDPLVQLWRDWTHQPMECDHRGQLTFAGLQRQVMRTVIESGECLVLRQDVQDNDTVGLRLQVLEPEYLDTNRRRSVLVNPSGGSRVDRDGIRFENGRPVGYWIFPQHPDDSETASPKSMLVPWENVIHFYIPERPGQRRGRTWLEPILDGVESLDDTLQSESQRFKYASMWVGFVTDLNGANTETVNQLSEVEPGTLELLPPGRDVKLSTPPSAPNLEQTTVVMLRRVAAGLGLPYETFTGDYTKTNFSSAKMAGNQLDAFLEEFRATVLYPMFLDRVFTWWKEAAAADDAEVTWTPPRARLVDPQKEVQALVEQVRAGFISYPDAVRSMGGDPDVLVDDIANSNSRLDELGIILDSDGRYSESGAGRISEEPTMGTMMGATGEEGEDGVSRED